MLFALLAPFYILGWIVCLVLFSIGRKRGFSSFTWIGGACLTMGVLIPMWMVALMELSNWKTSTPSGAYKENFGVFPTDDVTGLQSYYDSGEEWGTSCLKFKASASTIHSLTASGWKRETKAEIHRENLAGFTVPSWWVPKLTKATVIYVPQKLPGYFENEQQVLVYDTHTSQVYYAYNGRA